MSDRQPSPQFRRLTTFLHRRAGHRQAEPARQPAGRCIASHPELDLADVLPEERRGGGRGGRFAGSLGRESGKGDRKRTHCIAGPLRQRETVFRRFRVHFDVEEYEDSVRLVLHGGRPRVRGRMNGSFSRGARR